MSTQITHALCYSWHVNSLWVSSHSFKTIKMAGMDYVYSKFYSSLQVSIGARRRQSADSLSPFHSYTGSYRF